MKKIKIDEDLKRDASDKRRAKQVILLLAVVIAAFYVIGVIYFNSHFYLKNTAYGVSLAGKTVSAVKEGIAENLSGYTLNVTTRTGDELVSAADIDLEYDDQGEIDALMEEQNPFLWLKIFAADTDDIDLGVAMDEEALTDAVSAFSCMDEDSMQDPADAYLEYQDGEFVIVSEDEGTKLGFDAVFAAVRDAIYAGASSVSLEDEGCYAEPEVRQDNESLIAEMEELNALIAVEITYDFSDREETVTSDLIAEWIVLGEDFTYDLDEDLMYDYAYELGLKYDTMGLSREFVTHDGDTITLTGGDYGWCIYKSETASALKELILAGESVTTEPVYLYSGVCRDTDDIGGTYVEVDIDSQMMYCYEDYECKVETPVVTGNVSKGYDTPSGGVWAIDARISPYTLVGQDYDTDVTYWLPFNGNVGIHDASWRSSFGGDIYLTNGSHGCVNTPYDAMEQIYEIMGIGYPVVIY